MSKIGPRIRFIRLAWIALLCAFCCGCLAVPIRVPTKTRNISGATGKKLDLNFIKVGTTTREEVGQKLGWIDTGLKEDRIFIGRWADSSWGVAWAAGGGYSAEAGWSRAWTTHNLVLDFDEKGVVQQMSFFPDKDLLMAISARASKDLSHSLDLSTPREVPVEYIRPGKPTDIVSPGGKHFLGTLILGRDAFAFLQDRQTGAKEAYDFKTTPENISHLSMGHWVASDSLHPENVVVTIHFKQKTSVGSKINVQVDVPTTMILIKYIAQTQSGSALHSTPQNRPGRKRRTALGTGLSRGGQNSLAERQQEGS